MGKLFTPVLSTQDPADFHVNDEDQPPKRISLEDLNREVQPPERITLAELQKEPANPYVPTLGEDPAIRAKLIPGGPDSTGATTSKPSAAIDEAKMVPTRDMLEREFDRHYFAASNTIERPDVFELVMLRKAVELSKRQGKTSGTDWTETAFERMPFSGAIEKTKKATDLTEAANRIHNDPWAATAKDYLLVGDHLAEIERSAARPWWEKSLDIASDIPGYAIEIAWGGGAASALRTGGRATALRIIENSFLKNALGTGLARTAAQKIPAVMVGEIGRSLMNPQRIAQAAAERMGSHPQIGKDEAGNVYYALSNDDDSFLEALPTGFADAYVSFLSEQTGGLLKHIPFKNYASALKATILQKWLQLHPGSRFADFTKEIAKQSGWHGVIGEVFEEYFEKGVRGTTGLEDWSSLFPGRDAALEELLTMSVAFAMPGGTALTLQAAESGLNKLGEAGREAELQRYLAFQQFVSETQTLEEIRENQARKRYALQHEANQPRPYHLTEADALRFIAENPDRAWEIGNGAEASRDRVPRVGNREKRGRFAELVLDVLKKNLESAESPEATAPSSEAPTTEVETPLAPPSVSDAGPAASTTEAEAGGEASPANFGTLENPNWSGVSEHMRTRLLDPSVRYDSITQVRDEIGRALGGDPIRPGTEHAKALDEAIEAGIVSAARDIINTGREKQTPPRQVYEALVGLYDRSPTLGVRTSTSVAQQAYSTPAPIAYALSHLAGIGPMTTVYEPTAGNGMLLAGANPALTIVNELNESRRANLENQGYAVVSGRDATEFSPTWEGLGDVDVVIANPPFGTRGDDAWDVGDNRRTNQIEYRIVAKALESMKDDGRAAFLVAGPSNQIIKQGEKARKNFYNQRNRLDFWDQLYRDYNVVGHVTLSGDLYTRMGASYPVDLVVIEGKGKAQRQMPQLVAPLYLESYDELGGVFDDTRTMAILGRPDVGVVSSGVESDDLRRPDDAESPAKPDMGSVRRQSPVSPGMESEGRRPERAKRGGTGGVRPSESGSVDPEAGGQAGVDADVAEPVEHGNRRGGAVVGEGAVPPVAGGQAESRSGVGGSDSGDNARRVAPGDQAAGRAPGVNQKLESTSSESPSDESIQETDADGNEFQAAYKPISGNQSIQSFTPTNIAQAIQRSMTRFASEHGDIDAFVSDELQMTPKEIRDRFSGEQVDALGMAITQAKRGRGFIIGDQTGVGKGRFVAAMMRWAKLNGLCPVFITEKPNLYADMVRDLTDIGMNPKGGKFKPLITNNIQSTADQVELPDGDVLKGFPNHLQVVGEAIGQFAKDGRLAAVIKGKEWEFGAIFTTYSQMQYLGPNKPSARHPLFERIAPHAFFILDESHNAGGSAANVKSRRQSQTLPRASFIRGLLKHSRGVVYSSATFAKRADVLDLYFTTDMRLAVPDLTTLTEAVSRGGVPLQQIISEMLADVGQYTRREKDFTGIKFHPEQLPVGNEIAEAGSKAIADIYEIDEMMKHVVDEIDSVGRASTGGESGIDRTNFSARLHLVVNQLVTAAKVDAIVGKCLELLEKGEKPFIALEHTNESIIEDEADRLKLSAGQPADINYTNVLLRYLRLTRVVKTRGAGGAVSERYLTDDDLPAGTLRAYDRVYESIAQNDAFKQLPISPIDAIHQKLREKGHATAEITGRETRLEYRPGQPPLLMTRPSSERGIHGRQAALAGYNGKAGLPKVDVLIVNQAGATGVSAHASPRNGEDLRKRHMLIAQPAGNIDTVMQMLGRINRVGQVVLPEYTLLMTNMPVELRPAAVLMAKLASLNANTTGGRTSVVGFGDVPDFLNVVGDHVAAEIMDERRDWWQRMGEPTSTERNGMDRRDAMRKVTGRAILLPLAEQRRLFDELTERYRERVKQLDAIGANPLVAKTYDLDARTHARFSLFDGDPANPSPFAAGADIETVDMKRIGEPYKGQEVREMVEKTLGGRDGKQVAEEILGQMRDAAEEYVNAKTAALRKKLTQAGMDARDIDDRVAAQRAALEEPVHSLSIFLRQFHIGMPVLVDSADVDDTFFGIITSIARRGSSENPAALSTWRVKVAVADPSRQFEFNVRQAYARIDDDAGFHKTQVGLEAAMADDIRAVFATDDPFDAFDRSRRISRETRYVVTGNLLAAYAREIPRGQIMLFTRENGQRSRGVLLPKSFDITKWASDQPVAFRSSDQVLRFLDVAVRGVGAETRDRVLSITRHGNQYHISVPKSKSAGGKYSQHRGLLDALSAEAASGFVSVGNTMRVVVSRETAAKAIDVLVDEGATLYAFDEKETAAEISGTRRLPAPSSGGSGAASTEDSGELAGMPSLVSGPSNRPRVLPAIRDPRVLRPVSKPQIIAEAERITGAPIRHGHGWYRKLNASGWYHKGWHVISLKEFDDLQAAAHEVGHALHNRFLGWKTTWPQAVRDELHILGKELYGGQKAAAGYIREGLAEYVARTLWGDNPQEFAPETHAWMTSEVLPAHPELREGLAKLGRLYDAYVKQGAEARVREARSKTGKPVESASLGAKISRITRLAASMFDDRLAVLERRMMEINQERIANNLKPVDYGENPYHIARALGGKAGALAYDSVRNGVYSLLTGRKLAEGLIPSIEKLRLLDTEELEQFVDFLHARHALYAWAQNKNPGISVEDANHVYATHQNKPGWQAAADAITLWNKAHIVLLQEVGALSIKEAQAIIYSYPAYIPLKRVVDTLRKQGVSSGFVNLRAPTKRFKGSGRQVLDPFAAMMLQSQQMHDVAIRMLVGRKLAEYAETTPNMGWIAHPVEAPKHVIRMRLETIADQIEKAGGDLEDANLDELISLIQQSSIYRGPDTIACIWRGGQAKWYRFDQETYKTLADMEPRQIPQWADATLSILRPITQLKRLGATGLRMSFGFGMNFIRDLPHAMIFSEGDWLKEGGLLKIPFRTLAYVVKYGYTLYQNSANRQGDSVVEMFRRFGGELSTFHGQDIRRSYAMIREALQNPHWRRVNRVFRHPLEFLQTLFSLPEGAPRLAEIQQILERNGWTVDDVRRGREMPLSLVVECMMAANEATIDFHRRGSMFTWLNQIKAYSNAAVQGPMQTLRKAGIRGVNPAEWNYGRMARIAMRGFTLLTLPTIFYWLKVRDEEWYKELPAWRKYLFWNFRAFGKTWSIPKPFELGLVFASMPEAVLNSWHNNKSGELLKYLDEARRTAGPSKESLLPSDAMQLGVELITGYDFWREKLITDQYIKESREPKDWTTGYDTFAARYLGQKFNLPPAYIDHAIRQATGGLGIDLLRIPDEGVLSATGYNRFFRSTSRGESIDEFYSQRLATQRKYYSDKRSENLTDATRIAQRRFSDFASLMTDVRRACDSIPDDTERRELANRVVTGLARRAMGKTPYPTEYPDLFINDDLPQPLLDVRADYLRRLRNRAKPPTKTAKKTWAAYEQEKADAAQARLMLRELSQQ